MTEKKGRKRANPQDYMPEAEEVARELAKAESMDDFFGKESSPGCLPTHWNRCWKKN